MYHDKAEAREGRKAVEVGVRGSRRGVESSQGWRRGGGE